MPDLSPLPLFPLCTQAQAQAFLGAVYLEKESYFYSPCGFSAERSSGIFPFTSTPLNILQSRACSGKSVNLNSCFEVLSWLGI